MTLKVRRKRLKFTCGSWRGGCTIVTNRLGQVAIDDANVSLNWVSTQTSGASRASVEHMFEHNKSSINTGD